MTNQNRLLGLGGSDIGALFGLDKWTSLPQLWLEKTGRLFPQERQGDNEPQEWGKEFEALIARRYARKTGRRVQAVKRELVHPQYPFLRGHVDRRQFDSQRSKRERKGVLEIKATIFANLRPWSQQGIPPAFYLQLQHYLLLAGCSWGSFAVLFGGNRLVNFDLPRDEKVISMIIERAQQFWRLVETQTPPPIQLSQEWNEAMAALFPSPIKGAEIRLSTPEAIGRARRYALLEQQIAIRETELQEHETFFKAALGNAGERLIVPQEAKISWTASERKSIDVDRLRKEHPAIAEALTRRTPTRRFQLTLLRDIEEVLAEEPDEPTIILPPGARRIELD